MVFRYGNLRYLADEGWVFVENGEIKKMEEEDFTIILNKLGKDGWELVLLDEYVGYIFKKKKGWF